jgi:hypothetical protein
LGVYQIKAAVPSPYINVLCANVDADEIAPLVYEAAVNSTLVPSDLTIKWMDKFNWTALDATTTPVDDLFGWTQDNIQNRPGRSLSIQCGLNL